MRQYPYLTAQNVTAIRAEVLAQRERVRSSGLIVSDKVLVEALVAAWAESPAISSGMLADAEALATKTLQEVES